MKKAKLTAIVVASLALAFLPYRANAQKASNPSAIPVYTFNADSSERTVVLPASYSAALNLAVRGFRPYNGTHQFARTYGATFGIIADVNQDHQADVALAGTNVDNLITLVLIYSSAGGPKAKVLAQMKPRELRPDADESDRAPDGRATVEEFLSNEKIKGVTWIRWQDGDCKSAGWQWTIRKGVIVKRASPCSYGE